MVQTLKNKKQSSQKGFVRETIQSDLLEGIIKIPRNFKHRMVEIIILPIDSKISPVNRHENVCLPIEKFAGAWAGETLVRENQGAYEIREDLK